MRAIRLEITEDPICSVRPRRSSFVIREDGLGGFEMYETTEGSAQADTEKWLSVGHDRELDLKISVDACDV